MERYKKRTIALCLASIITVVGAFGSDNYENTLMALKVNIGSGGRVNFTAFTKRPYKSVIKISRIDADTYVLTLAHTNNAAVEPKIESFENIKSISISTYPYTTESDGCTRIVVKTIGEPTLSASSALFISNTKYEPPKIDFDTQKTDSVDKNISEPKQLTNNEYPPIANESSTSSINKEKENNTEEKSVKNTYTPIDYSKIQTSNSSNEHMIVLLCVSIILLIIGLIFMFSKDRMASVVGEKDNFDIDDNNKKQNKTKRIRNTIKKLDTKYTASDIRYRKFMQDSNENHEKPDNITQEKEIKTPIVDLDKAYRESQNTLQADVQDNLAEDDLADLLNAFTVEVEKAEEPEEEPFDEEFFNKVINSKVLNFSKSDIEKINQLLQIEITPDTLDDLKTTMNKPVVAPQTQEQILADLLSTYTIKQNISFSQEDVSAIRKLMAVELDPDFIKDFTTNPLRTKAVEKEIKESNEKKHVKASEILTLNVKNLLPDLSLELKKHGNKSIQSEVKPITVYYSEGYEYEKLNVSEDISNITKELSANNPNNHYKPSYKDPIAASGYEVSTLAIKDELPDLADVRANPQKYQENNKTQKPKADENALLKSIANVTFKPFYEETHSENQSKQPAKMVTKEAEKTTDISIDIERSDNIIDLDSIKKSDNIKSRNETRNDANAQQLLKIIEAQKAERAEKKQVQNETIEFKKEIKQSIRKIPKIEKQKNNNTNEFKYNDKKYTIVKKIKSTQNSECYLVRSDKEYMVIGNLNNKDFVLKKYDTLTREDIQIRPNDKFNKNQLLIKVCTHKFIVNITEDSMEFVMDLC